jgi:hypothetical protein
MNTESRGKNLLLKMSRGAVFVGAITAAGITSTKPAAAHDEKTFCAELTESVKKANARGPYQVDKFTIQEAASVDCGLRVFAIRKGILVKSAQMKPGWVDRVTPQMTEMNCGNASFREAIAAGWTISYKMVTADGEITTINVNSCS